MGVGTLPMHLSDLSVFLSMTTPPLPMTRRSKPSFPITLTQIATPRISTNPVKRESSNSKGPLLDGMVINLISPVESRILSPLLTKNVQIENPLEAFDCRIPNSHVTHTGKAVKVFQLKFGFWESCPRRLNATRRMFNKQSTQQLSRHKSPGIITKLVSH